MRTSVVVSCILMASVSVATAGPERLAHAEMKESIAPPVAAPFYADSEWNVGLSALYASTANDYRDDRYIQADHAWGGGVAAKYFFRRYFGLGIEANGLHARRSETTFFFPFALPNERIVGGDHRLVGSVVGTFTLRYPLPNSRLSPYVFGGAGAMFGGGETPHVVATEVVLGPPFCDRFTLYEVKGDEARTRAVGQFGGGLEFRLAPHIGLTSDASWNVVDGPRNNFGTARTGINFAF